MTDLVPEAIEQTITDIRDNDREGEGAPLPEPDVQVQPLSRNARRLIEAGSQIAQESPDRTDFLHTVMCQVGLPRRMTESRTFERQSGHVSVLLEAGKLYNGKEWVQYPLPYGTTPRLVMVHLSSEAIRTRSRRVEVGDSMRQFLQILGMGDNGGQRGAYTTVRKQIESLAAYVSVLRRLGCPVFLVETRGHLFCRWDDAKGTRIRWRNPDVKLWVPPERFNFDGSGDGIGYHSDEHYRTWPEPWTDFERDHGCYLRTKTARNELASMLIERGELFWDFGMVGDALKSYHFARLIYPDDARYNHLHEARFKQYEFNRLMHQEYRREQRLRIESASKNPLGHPRDCTCMQCEYAARQTNRQPGIPPHGQSCQCFQCRNARAAAKPTGLPHHPAGCGCAGCHCNQNLHSQAFPGVPGWNPFF